MTRSQCSFGSENPLCNQRGLCLSDLLMAMTVGMVVVAGSLAGLSVVHTQAVQLQRVMTGQQEMRVGLEVFEQEVRMASAAAITTGLPGRLEFWANVHALETTTTAALASGHTVVPVQDGRGWGQGKSVRICGERGCEWHRLAQAGQLQMLVLSEPLSGMFPAGASVEVMNRVAYYTRADDAGRLQLMRMIDGGAGVLIGDLRALQLSYWDDRGRVTAVPGRVARVVVAIELIDSRAKVIREVSVRS